MHNPGSKMDVIDGADERQEIRPHHRRRSSVATNLVDSMRGLGRRATTSRLNTLMTDLHSPTKISTRIPLPSSPIDIPEPAPMIKLDFDLGPTALLPSDFGHTPKLDGETKPDNDDANDYFSDTGFIPHDREVTAGLRSNLVSRPVTPGELLCLSTEAFDSAFTGPLTPLPGTNLQLDLDDDHTHDPTEVFERSVESSPANATIGTAKLRTMSSLDALTEAGTPAGESRAAARRSSEAPSMKFEFVYAKLATTADDGNQKHKTSELCGSETDMATVFKPDTKERNLNKSLPKLDIPATANLSDTATANASPEHSCVLDPGEYEHFKTEFIFGDLRPATAPPEYDDGHASETSSKSSMTWPGSLYPQMFQRLSNSNNSSPARASAGTTHAADVGDVFWRSSPKHGSSPTADHPGDGGHDEESPESIDSENFPSSTPRTSRLASTESSEVLAVAQNQDLAKLLHIKGGASPFSDHGQMRESARPSPLRPRPKHQTATPRLVSIERRRNFTKSSSATDDELSQAKTITLLLQHTMDGAAETLASPPASKFSDESSTSSLEATASTTGTLPGVSTLEVVKPRNVT